MANIARVLHISDMHFIQSLTEKGRSLWAKSIHFGPKSHSFAKLDALSGKLQELDLTGNNIDLVLASGDISTDGDEASLKTALEFLESNEIYRGTPQRLVTYGLGATQNRRIILPGNHDRYGGVWAPTQGPSINLEKVFNTPQTYPYVVGFRDQEVKDNAEERAVIFFIFDSTASLGETAVSQMNPAYRIARGRIEDAECRWLVKQALKITADTTVPCLYGGKLPVDYQSCVRVAVLHHHPISASGTASEGFWTFMENNEAFVEACFTAGVDIVLFGHQHELYYHLRRPEVSTVHTVLGQEQHPIHFFCCPSTSEYSEDENGFYVFTFNHNDFTVDTYLWSDGSFVTTTAPPYSYYRTLPPGKPSRAATG